MALYSENRNFIFVHIYKCAGNSIRQILADNTPDLIEINGAHSTLEDIKLHFNNNNLIDKYNQSYKFSFVRNPYAWLISLYFYIIACRKHQYNKVVSNMSYVQFLFWLLDKINSKQIQGENKYGKLLDFLTVDNKIESDFIGKIETLEDDFKIISNKIGIVFETIPELNIKRGQYYDLNYRKYYNNSSKNIIRKNFESDLDRKSVV